MLPDAKLLSMKPNSEVNFKMEETLANGKKLPPPK